MTELDVASQRLGRIDFGIGGAWPLVAGFAVLAIPTFATLGQEVWTREFGAHGPIVISTGAWLLWRKIASLQSLARPGHAALAAGAALASLALYVFGRAYDFISIEATGLLGVGAAMLYSRFGARVLIGIWFPLFYLAFAVPIPNWLIDQITAPLKVFVALVATDFLRSFDIPVAREGVTLFVAQYQLLVEDACSGLNSIIGLTAVSLFYIYLMRGSSLIYAAFLTCLVIPVAIVANILRIIILVLLTYFFGDQVAQGFLHFAAGIFLFAASLLMVFAIDGLVFSLRARFMKTA